MHFKSGQREFIVDTQEFIYSRDNEYLTVGEVDKKKDFSFQLPKHVVDKFKFIFSWDRYHEDLNKEKVLLACQIELSRLEKLDSSHPNILKGIDDMKRFIKDLL